MSQLLEVRDLKKHFPVKKGFLQKTVATVRAVDGVSFSIPKGKTLGLVGESGCGKSTLGRTICGIYEPTSGQIQYAGHDVASFNKKSAQDFRKKVQMIFQDPYASLDPRMTVYRIISEPLRIHKIGNEFEMEKRVLELMDIVGLKKSHMNRYPHEFSGGQRQRIGIARALALRPELIIADEPVSALDVSIQAQILNLLKDLQKEFGLTYLFISHNLAVVEHMCDEIAVMYLGKIVEQTKRETLFRKPLHPYTQALLKAVPVFGQGKTKIQSVLTGDVPSPIDPPQGCHFNPRCSLATQECKSASPNLLNLTGDHKVACVLYKSFEKGESHEATEDTQRRAGSHMGTSNLVGDPEAHQ